MEETQTPQQQLAVAEEHLRRGAAAVGPRRPAVHAAVTLVAATAFGACYDIPWDWYGVGAIIRFPLVFAVIVAWTLYTRAAWRARPRPTGYGRWAMPLVLSVHLVVFLAAAFAGLRLRDVGVSVPFTLAGLGYGVVAVALVFAVSRWARARYTDRVGRGHW